MEFAKEIFVEALQFDSLDIEIFFLWITVSSVIAFILSLILLPYMVRRIPSKYFLELTQERPSFGKYGIKPVLIFLVRNIFGFLLLISGIAMLFLPGQGLITIFLAIIVMDFPMKRKLILYLISLPKIKKTINWMRRKSKSKPIDWP